MVLWLIPNGMVYITLTWSTKEELKIIIKHGFLTNINFRAKNSDNEYI